MTTRKAKRIKVVKITSVEEEFMEAVVSDLNHLSEAEEAGLIMPPTSKC